MESFARALQSRRPNRPGVYEKFEQMSRAEKEDIAAAAVAMFETFVEKHSEGSPRREQDLALNLGSLVTYMETNDTVGMSRRPCTRADWLTFW